MNSTPCRGASKLLSRSRDLGRSFSAPGIIRGDTDAYRSSRNWRSCPLKASAAFRICGSHGFRRSD